MRLIDVDAFWEQFETAKDGIARIEAMLPSEVVDATIAIYDEIKERLDATPTVDAVPVIRCMDCKFWQNQEEGVIEAPICARPENKYEKHPFRFIIGKDGFCSYAERRSDGAD